MNSRAKRTEHLSTPTVEKQWMQARTEFSTSVDKVDQKYDFLRTISVVARPRWPAGAVWEILERRG